MFPFSSKSEVSGRARRFAPRGEIGSKRHLEQTGRVHHWEPKPGSSALCPGKPKREVHRKYRLEQFTKSKLTLLNCVVCPKILVKWERKGGN